MKLLSTLLLALLSASFFYGCSEDTVTPNTYTIQDIFPMAVGSRWDIRSFEYDTSNVPSSIDTAYISIDKATTLNGIPAFEGSAFDNRLTFYYIDKDLFRLDSGATTRDFMLRYPMAAGEVYVVEDTTYSDSFRSYRSLRLLSENEKTTVPAGTFDCIKYELLNMYGAPSEFDTSSISYVYFSPYTGYIKEDIYSGWDAGGPKIRRTSELLKYTK